MSFCGVPCPAKKYNVSGGRQGEWKRWGGTGRESKPQPQWMKLETEGVRVARCLANGLCHIVKEWFLSPDKLENLFPFQRRSMERKGRGTRSAAHAQLDQSECRCMGIERWSPAGPISTRALLRPMLNGSLSKRNAACHLSCVAAAVVARVTFNAKVSASPCCCSVPQLLPWGDRARMVIRRRMMRWASRQC